MSVEMITTIVSVVAILLALAGGFGWMIHRMDEISSSQETRLGARIDKLSDRVDSVESGLGARIDGVESRLGARIDRLADEVVEVKIAVARIEGSPRRLLPAR